MTKNEMRTKLTLHKGVGVEVAGTHGPIYYFYEDFDGDDGISRAYKHFNHGESLTFYTGTWAKQSQFKEYMNLYNRMVYIADIANKEFDQNPESERAEKRFNEAYNRQVNYLAFLCKQLINWTGCTFDSAKQQIITNQVRYSAFIA